MRTLTVLQHQPDVIQRLVMFKVLTERIEHIGTSGLASPKAEQPFTDIAAGRV